MNDPIDTLRVRPRGLEYEVLRDRDRRGRRFPSEEAAIDHTAERAASVAVLNRSGKVLREVPGTARRPWWS